MHNNCNSIHLFALIYINTLLNKGLYNKSKIIYIITNFIWTIKGLNWGVCLEKVHSVIISY